MTEASSRSFNGAYTGVHLEQIAFPLGGMGAGMICLDGTGALAKFSLRHQPELSADRRAFAAISIRDTGIAKVLEGPVPECKRRPHHPGKLGLAPNMFLGLPRFRAASFEARFPFAKVRLIDGSFPLQVEMIACTRGPCLPMRCCRHSVARASMLSTECFI